MLGYVEIHGVIVRGARFVAPPCPVETSRRRRLDEDDLFLPPPNRRRRRRGILSHAGPPPTAQATASPGPTSAGASWVGGGGAAAVVWVACGQSVKSSTSGHPSEAGNPSPEKVFAFEAGQPVQVKATTCSLATAFRTSLTLWDQHPINPTVPNGGAARLLASEAEGYACSILVYDLQAAPRDLWLLVEVSFPYHNTNY